MNTEQKCCEKCLQCPDYPNGTHYYCHDKNCPCHHNTLTNISQEEAAKLVSEGKATYVPSHTEQKGWEARGIENGLHDHSIYTHCRSCNTWGINKPLETICGNCGNQEDTTTYYPKEFVERTLQEQREEMVKTVYAARKPIPAEVSPVTIGTIMNDITFNSGLEAAAALIKDTPPLKAEDKI